MTDNEKRALKEAHPNAAFILVHHPLGEAILAVPRIQDTQEKTDAISLWHGSTVKLSA